MTHEQKPESEARLLESLLAQWPDENSREFKESRERMIAARKAGEVPMLRRFPETERSKITAAELIAEVKQKPESAEFRTRDVNAWQPISTAPKDGSYIDLWVLGLEEEFRFENAHYGVEHHDCGEYGRYCDSCPAPGKRWIDAFGMEIAGTVTHWRAIPASPKAEAEQRRKDAEGAEPFAWVSPEDVDPRNTWCNGKGYGFRILEHHSIQTPTATIPLYTRPASVVALEARVKELEAQLGAIQNGTVRQVIHSPLRHFKPEDRS